MLIAGTDEVGVGCLAGPLVAVTVTMDAPIPNLDRLREWWPIDEVDDSKKLTVAKREHLRGALPSFIIENHGEVGIGISSVSYIDDHGYAKAWDRALSDSVRKATRKVDLRPKLLVVDGTRSIDGYPWNQMSVKKADQKYFLVAAASILAKIIRDDIMISLDKKFPEYDWKNNKGYGTEYHEMALVEYGLTEHHRKQPCKTVLTRLGK